MDSVRLLSIVSFLDRLFVGVIRYICVALLAAMVGFIVYTVIMRYVFSDPPFWGDTLAIFANIWFVLLAFALAVHDREHIAMQGLYDWLPSTVTFCFRFGWDVLILLVGIFMLIYGTEIAQTIRGRYWELSGLSKGVPMSVIPIAGGLVIIAAMSSMAGDLRKAMTHGISAADREGIGRMVSDQASVRGDADAER